MNFQGFEYKTTLMNVHGKLPYKIVFSDEEIIFMTNTDFFYLKSSSKNLVNQKQGYCIQSKIDLNDFNSKRKPRFGIFSFWNNGYFSLAGTKDEKEVKFCLKIIEKRFQNIFPNDIFERFEKIKNDKKK